MAMNTELLEYYKVEASYVSPTEISNETAKKIRNRNNGLGKIAMSSIGL